MDTSNYTVWAHFLYLAISIGMTIWVASTLYKNGRVFLVDVFAGNTELADSVNHLLVVGFYLINIGYIALALKGGATSHNMQELVENLSTKVGIVLLILGGMHLFNVYVFNKMRKRALEEQAYAVQQASLEEKITRRRAAQAGQVRPVEE